MKEQDNLLVELVSAVGEHFPSIGITLTIGGSIISGILITEERYMELLAEAASGELRSYLISTPTGSKTEKAEYIHLSKAYYAASNMGFSEDEEAYTLWRGKISSIDGFQLGRYRLDPKD